MISILLSSRDESGFRTLACQAVESFRDHMELGVHSEAIVFLSGHLPLLSARHSTA